MAVQAQHPSNVFFLNSINGQEGNDCSLHPQKPHFPSINNGARGVPSVDELEVAAAPMNPPPSKVIDLTQLHNHHRGHQQPNVVSIGLRLSPSDRHGREQLFPSFPVFPGDLTGEIKRQTDELDRFLHTQGEQLRRTLAENRERHYRELLCAAEELVARRLREKDSEMEKATRRHAKMEARAAQLAAEARVWQVRAAAREAEAASLQARLQQAIAGSAAAAAVAAERVECGGDAEDAESVYVDPERVEVVGPSCRICRRRSATVVALPCRHLGLCKECDGATRACPLCLASKDSSVEVFFS